MKWVRFIGKAVWCSTGFFQAYNGYIQYPTRRFPTDDWRYFKPTTGTSRPDWIQWWRQRGKSVSSPLRVHPVRLLEPTDFRRILRVSSPLRVHPVHEIASLLGGHCGVSSPLRVHPVPTRIRVVTHFYCLFSLKSFRRPPITLKPPGGRLTNRSHRLSAGAGDSPPRR